LVGKLSSPNYVWGLSVHNNIAYIAEHPGDYRYLAEESDSQIVHTSGVQFLDVSRPNNPFEINHLSVGDFVDAVATHNNLLLILSNHFPEPFTSTLLMIRQQDNNTPVQIGACPISGRGYQLAISGELVYVASFDGLHVIDISKPENPHEISHIGNHLSLEGRGIQYESPNLFVASYFQGLRIFNLQNGAKPNAISRTLLWGPADNVMISDNIVYVSDMFFGLWRFDLNNLENLVETGFYPLEHGERRIVIGNSYVFVAAKHTGLFILRNIEGQLNLNINHNPGHIIIFDD
jgi:hypothetical protein